MLLRRRRRDSQHRRLTTLARNSTTEPLEVRELLSGLTVEVTTLADSGSGSLRQAILDTNAEPGHDTIEFAEGLAGTIQLSSQLEITDDLTIDGPGAGTITVSGDDGAGGLNRVFAVLPEAISGANINVQPSLADVADAPAVSISGLTITSGLAADAPGYDPADPTNPGFAFGGGIYNLGGTVTLSHMNMTGNQARGVVTAGGAVANEFGGTLRVFKSAFGENVSSGALIAVGGAITSDLGSVSDGPGETTGQPEVVIGRSKFVNNSASTLLGYIDGVAFSGLAGGGALLNVTGSLNVSRSQFRGNTANGGSGGPDATAGGPAFGGAILSGDASPFGIAESQLSISGSSFWGNHATGGDGGADGLPGGIGSGGAIAANNGTDATLWRNRFGRNSATGGDGGTDADGGTAAGGAISAGGTAAIKMGRNALAGNQVRGGSGSGTGASAAGFGGGLALSAVELAGFFPGAAAGSLNRDVFKANQAWGGVGGGIYNEGELKVSQAGFYRNSAIGLPDAETDAFEGYEFIGVALGGGLSNSGSMEIVGSMFAGNKALGADGAVGPNVLIDGSALYPGLGAGGGIHSIGKVAVSHSGFVGNAAVGGNDNFGSFSGVGNGGGIYNDGSLTVQGSRVGDNRAVGGHGNSGDINAGGGYGGGITSGSVAALAGLRSATLTVGKTAVFGNTAAGGDGNASVLPPDQVPPAHAPGSGVGGGIIVYQGTAGVFHSLVSGNHARGGDGGFGAGGGVFVFGFVGPVEAKFSGGLLSGNSAVGGTGGNGFGGGMAVGSLGSFFGGAVAAKLNRTVASHNRAVGGDAADGLGGGFYNDTDGSLSLKRSGVFRNAALAGTGGEGIGGGIFNLGTVDLLRTRVFANFATTSDPDCFGC